MNKLFIIIFYQKGSISEKANFTNTNDLLTVLPLTSKKSKHSTLKNWEYEITYPIKNLLVDKIINEFNIYGTKYVKLRNKIIALIKNASEIDAGEFERQYSKLIESGVNEVYSTNKDIMEFADKMSKGSIVEVNQIKTISKSRIIFPVKKSHALYDIKIHPDDLAIIQHKVIHHLVTDSDRIDISQQ